MAEKCPMGTQDLQSCPLVQATNLTPDEQAIVKDIVQAGGLACAGLVTVGKITQEERANLLALHHHCDQVKDPNVSTRRKSEHAVAMAGIALELTRSLTLVTLSLSATLFMK